MGNVLICFRSYRLSMPILPYSSEGSPYCHVFVILAGVELYIDNKLIFYN